MHRIKVEKNTFNSILKKPSLYHATYKDTGAMAEGK